MRKNPFCHRSRMARGSGRGLRNCWPTDRRSFPWRWFHWWRSRRRYMVCNLLTTEKIEHIHATVSLCRMPVRFCAPRNLNSANFYPIHGRISNNIRRYLCGFHSFKEILKQICQKTSRKIVWLIITYSKLYFVHNCLNYLVYLVNIATFMRSERTAG